MSVQTFLPLSVPFCLRLTKFAHKASQDLGELSEVTGTDDVCTSRDFADYLFELSGAEGGRQLTPDVFPVVIPQLSQTVTPRLEVQHFLRLQKSREGC